MSLCSHLSTKIIIKVNILRVFCITSREKKIDVKKFLTREAIEMSLAVAPQSEEREKDPFEDVIGIAKSGIKDASSKHDRYLYGRKRGSYL